MEIQFQNITFSPRFGGVENYIFEVGKVIKRDYGASVKILCSKDRKTTNKEIYECISKMFEIRRHEFLPPLPGARLRMIKEFIKRESRNPKIVIARHPYYALASERVLDAPVIFFPAASWPSIMTFALKTQPIKKMMYSILLKKADEKIEKEAILSAQKNTVLSKLRAKELSELYGVNEQGFEVNPPGVDCHKFSPKEKDRSLLEELNVPSRAKIILFVGRLSSEKNVSFLLKSFSEVKEKSSFLFIVGNGPEKNRLVKEAKMLGVYKRVKFAGFRTDVDRFYSTADVFVLPSIYEGFGHVFLEAMASGLPAMGLKPDFPEIKVATDEIISHGRDGFLVSNTDELASKLDVLLSNKELAAEMGKSAREKARTFTWERHTEKLLRGFV
jgi:glycosyltransferase involved in cell wall biosynthesis